MSNVRLHPRFLQVLLLSSLSLACVGCWEEIRYDPSKEPLPQRPRPQETAALENKGQEPLPAPESKEPEPPVAEEPDAPLEVTLESNEGLPTETTSPVPPAEINWLEDTLATELAESTGPIVQSPTAPAAWQMGSQWSLAAAYFAKGSGADRYGKLLKQAGSAAELLDLQLPALPEKPNDAALQPAVIHYLLEEGGPRLVDQLNEQFSADHAALAELAIKTHALLLVYTPGNKDLDTLVSAIRLAAENSGLPESVWRELVDLLEQRAEFVNVKKAVFKLHDQTTAHLTK